MRNAPRRLALGLIALLVGVTSVSARAQTETDLDGLRMVVESLVDDLDAELWIDREAASEELARAGGLPLELIEEPLRRTDLTGEQRLRLRRAAEARFAETPKGGLGVQFGSATLGSVQIQLVVGGENFPAGEMLLAGDVIIAIGGELADGVEGVRAEILSRSSGETLPVLLRRGRTLLEMELPLGSYGDLTGAASLDRRMLARALTKRHERLGIPSEFSGTNTRAIGSALDADAWIGAAFPDGRSGEPGNGNERNWARVINAGSSGSREALSNRRTLWTSADIAAEAVRNAHRAVLSRGITAGVRTRAMLLELENSIEARIDEAREGGMQEDEIDASLRRELALVNDRLAEIDADMMEMTRQLDALNAP